MAKLRDIKRYPDSYRAREMKQLVGWIRAGESGSVVGLVGCGRTNLLEFLGHRPDVVRAYLPEGADRPVLVPVDLNQVPARDPATLYRVLLRAFYWGRAQFEAETQSTITALYQKNLAVRDAFVVQSALHEALFAFRASQTQVALILNRFDRFCQTASERQLNTLRGLRDSFKETLCFIVGMRRPATYLENRAALGSMYDLLDSKTCWVGPMADEDARWVIRQAMETAAETPADTEINAMLDLSGGFPALLRALGYWWLSHPARPPVAEWRAQLEGDASFMYRLEKLWQGLSEEEHAALAAVVEGQTRIDETPGPDTIRAVAEEQERHHGPVLRRLAEKSVCYQDERGWQMVSQLWIDYARQKGPASRGRLRLDEKTHIIYQGTASLEETLTGKEDGLLRFMLEQPEYARLSKSVLKREVWREYETDDDGPVGITDNNLQRLVLDVRKKIEVDRHNPRYLVNYPGSPEGGYQLFPEGRPDGD